MRNFASLQADDWPLRLAGHAGLALLFAALLTFLAPFGTYRFEPVERVGYWTVQMAAWLILSLAAGEAVRHFASLRAPGMVPRWLVATLMATLPMMAVTGMSNTLLIGWRPDASELLELFLSIALIGGRYIILADRLIDWPASAPAQSAPENPGVTFDPLAAEQDPPATTPADTALFDRLPPHLRTGILCLQVEDHYVRVHAREGSAMVLMRFSDALRGIGHIPGSQVHRSWWVADDAVAALRKTGRTAQLVLRNGKAVPVSQPYLAHAMRAWSSVATSTT